MAVENDIILNILAETKKANKAFNTFFKQTQKGLSKTEKSIDQVQKKMLTLGKAILANLASRAITSGINVFRSTIQGAASDFLDFSKAVAEINTILPKNQDITEETRKTFIRFSATFGGTPAEQAKAFYQIVSAGITDVEAATNLLNVANIASIAGVTDIRTAIDGLTSVLAVFAQDGLTAARASDILFTTVRLGKTTFEDLSNNIGSVAPIARAAGVSFDELTGSIAFLTKVGISNQRTATALRATFTSLIKPSKDAAKAFKSLGIDVSLATIRAGGLVPVFEDIIEKTNGSVEELGRLFPNIRALSAVVAITRGNFADYKAILQEVNLTMDSSSRAFKKMEKSASFQFDRLRSELASIPQLLLAARDEEFAAFFQMLRTEILPAVVRGFAALAKIMEVTIRVTAFLAAAFGGLILPLTGTIALVLGLATALTGDLRGAFEIMAAPLNNINDNLNIAFSKNKLLDDLATGLSGVASEIENTEKSFKRFKEEVQFSSTAIGDLSGNIFRLPEALVSLQNALKNAGLTQLQILRKLRTDRLKILTATLEDATILEKKRLDNEIIIAKDFAKKQRTSEQDLASIILVARDKSTFNLKLLQEATDSARLKTQLDFSLKSTKIEEARINKLINIAAKAGGEAATALRAEQEIERLRLANEEKLLTEEEFQIAKSEVIANAENERIKKLIEREVQAGEFVGKDQVFRLKRQLDFIKMRLANEKLGADQRLANEKQANKVSLQLEDAKNKKLLSQRSTFLSTVATLAQEQNGILKAIGKTAALVSIAIDTQKAGAAGFAFGTSIGGPGLGAIFKAIALAAGAASAARVASLQKGLTSVPSGFPNDSFPARLTTGERVVNVAQNRDLTEFLAAQSQDGNAGLEERLDSVIEALGEVSNNITDLNLETTVNIGNKTIINEVRDGLRAGRTLTA